MLLLLRSCVYMYCNIIPAVSASFGNNRSGAVERLVEEVSEPSLLSRAVRMKMSHYM